MGTKDDEYDYLFKGKTDLFLCLSNKWIILTILCGVWCLFCFSAGIMSWKQVTSAYVGRVILSVFNLFLQFSYMCMIQCEWPFTTHHYAAVKFVYDLFLTSIIPLERIAIPYEGCPVTEVWTFIWNRFWPRYKGAYVCFYLCTNETNFQTQILYRTNWTMMFIFLWYVNINVYFILSLKLFWYHR